MPIILDYDTEEVYTLEAKPKGKDKYIYIVFLGDIHFGHKDCSVSYLRKTIKLIEKLAKRHNVVVILMGDLIETDKDYASQYMIEDVVKRTKEQFEGIVQILYPIRNLCKFALWGNHEERLLRDAKSKRLLEMLKIENFYERILKELNPSIVVAKPQRGMLIQLKVGKKEYDVRIAHGAYGGYKRPELQTERESNNYPTASLIAMGHHHQKYFKEVVKMAEVDGKRAIMLQYWIGTGTMLRYPAYAERKSYPVNVMGCPIIKVYSEVQHIEYMNSPEFHPRFVKASGMLPLDAPRMDFGKYFRLVRKLHGDVTPVGTQKRPIEKIPQKNPKPVKPM